MKRVLLFFAVWGITFIVAVQPVAAATTSFPDVPESNRFHDEIQYLVNKEIISGYSNGKFQPKRNVTRAEAAIMIGRMLGYDGKPRATQFTDVTAQNGASGYISEAAVYKVISGYPDRTFRPNEYISRGDMAIILARAFDIETGSVRKFKDVSEQMKAYSSIKGIAGNFITTGYSDGTFRPASKVSREQFSAFLARGLSSEYKQRTVKKDGYSRDMTKKYVFNSPNGDIRMEYKKTTGKFAEVHYAGFFWVSEGPKSGDISYLQQEETDEKLIESYPFSEYYTDLKYPVEVGKSWVGPSPSDMSKITGINKTVKTPCKTFTNAVEVTVNGFKLYYVKGIGSVKTVNPTGKVVSELKSIQ
ncbi:S-layer homology domain-containing protein [Sporosarcina sp. ZBG7A]|uniref:S-layer homology domain-containing protein n=1 Tax=Sporosarcina sp. ZBG7A TaxID=1582223 RepID=UPI000691318E|nr:S-layer homology domain-containing protein [Sporosarcina sp. ZBG7A]